MPRDTCQWLRHLILTTQSIILPVKVKLGVLYIKIANVCSVCKRHLAASYWYNIVFVQRFDTNVEFQFKKLAPNLDTTNLTVDPALEDHRRMRMKLSQQGQKESSTSAHSIWGASPRRRSWSKTSTCSTTWTNLLTLTFVCVDVDLDRALFNKHSKTCADLFFAMHNCGTST